MDNNNWVLTKYFDLVYNRVYDTTVGKLQKYHQLQGKCIRKLTFDDSDLVLCLGMGTGNEIYHILRNNNKVRILGVDRSRVALTKAQEKASRIGAKIQIIQMDARRLQFPPKTFDTVVCIHLMDFIREKSETTSEILRVLKDGGQFAITYPSGKEDFRMGFGILKDDIRGAAASGKKKLTILRELLLPMLPGIACLPMFLRRDRDFLTQHELECLFTHQRINNYEIEEDNLYNDFIVYGTK